MSSEDTPDQKLVQTTFTFSVKGVDYVFRIPSVSENIALGARARAIRAKADPASMGQLVGLDQDTVLLAYGAAAMELFLEKCSDEWPVTRDVLGKLMADQASGRPVVDHTKFPPNRTNDVKELGARFYDALERFCAGGSAD